MKEERLIIKNFGPIKHIDIPIRKINILIGDQGTGKSTVAKVLACLLSIDFILLHKSESINYFKKYKLDSYLHRNTFISLTFSGVEIKYEKKEFHFTTNNNTKQDSDILQLISSFSSLIGTLSKKDKTEALSALEKTIKGNNNANLSNYIPAERNILTSFSNSPFSYLKSGIEFSDYLLSFGEKYDKARKDNAKFAVNHFGVLYEHSNALDYVTINNKKLLLNEAASGVQNIIPIYLILESQKDATINIIEEPEISLFPKSQNILTQYLCSYSISNKSDLLITTHSPYVLTTINNLMYAYKVGKIKGKSAIVGKIIDKKNWIDSKDVSAYMLNANGEAEDLMDYEINQIKAEKIDEISRVINEEFDQLLKIEFSKTK